MRVNVNLKTQSVVSGVLMVVPLCLLHVASEGASPVGPIIDPCSLVTRAEMEQIVGKLNGDPRPSPFMEEGDHACQYTLGNASEMVEVRVHPALGFDRAKRGAKMHTSVSGFGREAFLNRNAELEVLEFWVSKGNVLLEVNMPLPGSTIDKIKAIATRALTRL